MAQTKKANRDAYDRRTYRNVTIRVRRNSELNERLENFKAAPGTSLNYVMTKLLADYFDCPYPAAHNDIDRG